MTRQKAWIAAAAATVLVVLFVLAAGASFGQFGLGGTGARTGALASTPNQGAQRSVAVGEDDGEREYGDDEDDEDDDGEREHNDDEHEDGEDD